MKKLNKAGEGLHKKEAQEKSTKSIAGNNINHVVNSYNELEKGKSHIIVEIVEYMPNAVVSKTIIKRATGNVTAMSFAIGEELEEKMSPYDIYVQIIDGKAEIVLNSTIHNLPLGTGFVIPANAIYRFTANEQFKMLSTVIKSGYDL